MTRKELNENNVRKMLSSWAKDMREITLLQNKINNLIKNIYTEMNDVYKATYD